MSYIDEILERSQIFVGNQHMMILDTSKWAHINVRLLYYSVFMNRICFIVPCTSNTSSLLVICSNNIIQSAGQLLFAMVFIYYYLIAYIKF